jgi:hypothetical protein
VLVVNKLNINALNAPCNSNAKSPNKKKHKSISTTNVNTSLDSSILNYIEKDNINMNMISHRNRTKIDNSHSQYNSNSNNQHGVSIGRDTFKTLFPDIKSQILKARDTSLREKRIFHNQLTGNYDSNVNVNISQAVSKRFTRELTKK